MSKIIISGSSNLPLAQSLSKHLDCEVGDVEISHFANGEKRIKVLADVRDKEVLLVQSGCTNQDEYLIETCLLANAIRNMGAAKIKLIMPWLSYSPQDKIFRDGEALSSKVVISILENAEIDEYVYFDLHSSKLLEFFRKPYEHHSTQQLYIDYFNANIKDHDRWVVLSVDKGDLAKSTNFAQRLGVGLAALSKTRDLNTGEVTFLDMKGSVEGKKVITFDDYVSTGQTLIKSADYIKSRGATEFYYCVTHIVVENALPMIVDSKVDRIVTTNSIHLPTIKQFDKVEVLDLARLIK